MADSKQQVEETLEFKARERALVHAKHFSKESDKAYWTTVKWMKDFLLGSEPEDFGFEHHPQNKEIKKGEKSKYPPVSQDASGLPVYRMGDHIYIRFSDNAYIAGSYRVQKSNSEEQPCYSGSPYKIMISKDGKDKEVDISDVKIAKLKEEKS